MEQSPGLDASETQLPQLLPVAVGAKVTWLPGKAKLLGGGMGAAPYTPRAVTVLGGTLVHLVPNFI